jgi:hypothetical protein
MVKSKIYQILLANDYMRIVPEGFPECALPPPFNAQSLLSEWGSKKYDLQSLSKRDESKIPKATITMDGGFAIQEHLKELLFPDECSRLEFLPIRVGRQNWFIVNCLQSVSGYDSEHSILYRGLNGDIFMVIHLVLTGRENSIPNIFVIEDSNRASVFANQQFVDLCTNSGIDGVNFKQIGEVVV